MGDPDIVREATCRECEWEAVWSGASFTESPAIEHTAKTGHSVHSRPRESGGHSD